MWPSLFVAVVFLVLPLLNIGFAFLGKAISPLPRGTSTFSVWPSQGEVVGTLTPTLRWPGAGGGDYEISLYLATESQNVDRFSTLQVGRNRVTIPRGLLLEDQTYFWSVASVAGDSLEPLYSGSFSTTTSVKEEGFLVTPAAYHVNLHTLQQGIDFTFEGEEGALVEVFLPPVLSAGGADKISGTAPLTLNVRPSVKFSAASVGGPASGDLGRIEVRMAGARASLPVIVDVSSVGMLLRNVHSGFDPVLDTPVFPNFAEGVLATITNGTCLGMVLAAQAAYDACRECDGKSGCRCGRLRLRSMLEEEEVRQEMNFLHLANLDPQNWSLAVSSLVSRSGQFGIAAELLGSLREGRPVPVAVVSATTDGEPDASSMGHAVLVFSAHEFDDLYVFYVYDPDEVYRPRAPLASFLAVARNGSDTGRVLFFSRDGLREVEAYALPEPGVLTTLSPTVYHTFSSLDVRLATRLRTGSR